MLGQKGIRNVMHIVFLWLWINFVFLEFRFGSKKCQKRYACSASGYFGSKIVSETLHMQCFFEIWGSHFGAKKCPKRYVYSAFGDVGVILGWSHRLFSASSCVHVGKAPNNRKTLCWASGGSFWGQTASETLRIWCFWWICELKYIFHIE